MRVGLFAALTIALAAIVGADAAQGAAPIACSETALRSAVSAGGVIEMPAGCTVQLGSPIVIAAGASVRRRRSHPAHPPPRRCSRR